MSWITNLIWGKQQDEHRTQEPQSDHDYKDHTNEGTSTFNNKNKKSSLTTTNANNRHVRIDQESFDKFVETTESLLGDYQNVFSATISPDSQMLTIEFTNNQVSSETVMKILNEYTNNGITISTLDLSNCSEIADLDFLKCAPNIREIIITGCSKLNDETKIENGRKLLNNPDNVTITRDVISNPVNRQDTTPISTDEVGDSNKTPQVKPEDNAPVETLISGYGEDTFSITQNSNDSCSIKFHENFVTTTKVSEILEECKTKGIRITILDLSGCKNITNLQFLQFVPELENLNISDCASIDDLNGMQNLENLKIFTARHCHKLENLNGMGHTGRLQSLDVSFCSKLKNFEGIGIAHSLKTLTAINCDALESFKGLENSKILQSLHVPYCRSLKSFEGLSDTRNLRSVDISYCINLKDKVDISDAFSLNQCSVNYNGTDIPELTITIDHNCPLAKRIGQSTDIIKIKKHF